MADDLQGLRPADAARLSRVVRWYEGGGDFTQPAGTKSPEPPGNIRCVLLSDLASELTVEAAVTDFNDTHDIQAIRLLGDVTGGTFKIKYKASATATAEVTTALSVSAKAKDVRKALNALPSLINRTLKVTALPGCWYIQFVGRAPGTVERLEIDSTLITGTEREQAVIREKWFPNGGKETVRPGEPVGDPTPLVAGTIAWCSWHVAAGYCVTSAESRDFAEGF